MRKKRASLSLVGRNRSSYSNLIPLTKRRLRLIREGEQSSGKPIASVQGGLRASSSFLTASKTLHW